MRADVAVTFQVWDCCSINPSPSIFQTKYDSQGSIFGRQGSCSVPTLRTVAEIVRLDSSTIGPLTSVTLDSFGSKRIVRALRYFARDVTSFVGSMNRQSSRKISGVRSPLMG